MRFHKIEMRGSFVLQKVDALPSFSATRDEGRLLYLNTDKKVYRGTDSEWQLFADIESYSGTATSATSWTVTHNLDSHNLIVDVWNDSNEKISPNSIIKNTTNQLTIDFGSASVAGRFVIIKTD